MNTWLRKKYAKNAVKQRVSASAKLKMTKETKVIVYTTPICPWCEKVKEFLRENKVKFETIDVSKDKKAAQEMVKKSGQMGVPVVEINGKMIVGFDEDAIRNALGI